MRKRPVIGLVIVVVVTVLMLYNLHPYYELLNPVGGIWTAPLGAEHPPKTEITLEGLTDVVEVYRDSWGVPHIYAKSEEDLFYAFGYVQAQDRLWQMDFQRRVAEGKLAEVLGKDLYETDLFFRVIGLARAANKTHQQLDSKTKKTVEWFAKGVNRAIEDMKKQGNLPVEFKLLEYEPEPWNPLDMYAFAKLMGWMLTGSFYDIEFMRLVEAFGFETANELFPVDRPEEVWIHPGNYKEGSPASIASSRSGKIDISDSPNFISSLSAMLRWKGEAEKWLLPLKTCLGSNNWVVNGSMTATGKPILCNDPHLELTAPPVWYEAHLVVSNASGVVINVRGVTFPGVPYIVIGHNQHVAWGMTNVGADVIDFYRYVWSEGGLKYWYVDHWEPVNQVKESIKVKTDGGAEERAVYINLTRHGPILERYGHKFAMQWSGHHPTFEARALYKFNMARNIEDFMAGLADFHVPAQNFVFADVYGNIAWWANGKYPNRTNVSNVHELRVPFNGSEGKGEWSSDWIEPPKEVPHVINPPWGFVVTANNRPVGPAYPYWLGWTWAERYRAQRILELINLTQKIDADYMKAVQTDVLLIPARELAPYIIAAYEKGQVGGELVAEAIEILRAWNYVMDKEGVAPTIFATWLDRLERNTFDDEYKRAGIDGPYPLTEMLEYFVKENVSKWFDDVTTPETETRDDIVTKSLVEAVEQLQETLGTNVSTWTWGKVHVFSQRHRLGEALNWLNYPELPADGWTHCVNPAPHVHPFDVSIGGLKARHGASWRQIIDLSNLENSLCILPGGQSGNPFSPHYRDQLELWLNGEYKPMTFPASPEEQEDVGSTMVFRPR